MKKYAFLLFCGSFLAACQHDYIMPPPDVYDKYCVPDTLPPFKDVSCRCFSCDDIYDTLKYVFSDVCFNPNNPYQIAYLRSPINYFGLKKDIWVFDFETGENKIVGTNAAYGLSWSAKGWLAFTGLNRQIYKLKSNGDSLTQLTKRNAYCNYPEWNEKGDKIVFSTDVTAYFHFLDEQGKQIDSAYIIKAPFFSHKWVNDTTLLVSYSDGEVVLLNLISKTKKEVRNRPLALNTLNFAKLFGYSPQSQAFYWTGINGLQKTDLQTRKTVLLQEEPVNTYKMIGNYCRQTDKLLAVRTVIDFYHDPFNPNPCKRRKYQYLTIMNTDGTNERKIVFPQ
jgi:hypothetical protein